MKRIFLFLATNLAIILTIGLLVNILGLNTYLTKNGINHAQLLGFAFVVGFTGSIFSLMISKWMAKISVGAQVITGAEGAIEAKIVRMVENHAQKLGLTTPEIAIFNDNSMNAFATGPSKNNALVAVSTGLIHNMNDSEIEAVIGHEMAHIANGDMVTLTLIQGVLNTFVVYFSRLLAFSVSSVLSKNDDSESPAGGLIYTISSLVLDLMFGIVASIIVAWFSRQREYRADAGGAQLTSSRAMAAALMRLKHSQESELPNQVKAFGIRSNNGFMALFSSHPPLDDRIDKLIKH